MKEKAKIDKTLHYIKRKTKTTADGKEVVSKLHAELAAKMAFEGGRQSVLDNIPELEWKPCTREELIEKTAKKYCQDNIPSLPQMHLAIQTAFEAGAKWADEHPPLSASIDVWNLATETAIKQLGCPVRCSEKQRLKSPVKLLT